MKCFHDIQAENVTGAYLRDVIGDDGYALIRDVIPREIIEGVLGDVTKVLAAAGWLIEGTEPMARSADPSAVCGDPDPSFKRTYQQVFNLESLHALPHHPSLRRIMEMLVGERLLVHPKPIGRLIFPNCEGLVTHAHQDYRFMDGDPECFTAWMPLHDCPLEMGPLRILEGSHRFGIQRHDQGNVFVPAISSGFLRGREWVGGRINTGDVLIFHSLTVHAAMPNISAQMRISLDCRFQDYARAIHPGNLAFAGESGKSWEKTYADWRSSENQFYWKALPLILKPSKDEIEELSRTSDSPMARARYSRIVSQIA